MIIKITKDEKSGKWTLYNALDPAEAGIGSWIKLAALDPADNKITGGWTLAEGVESIEYSINGPMYESAAPKVDYKLSNHSYSFSIDLPPSQAPAWALANLPSASPRVQVEREKLKAQAEALDATARADLAEAAADLLETKGWCQDFYAHDGSYCAVGALQAAAGQVEGIATNDISGISYLIADMLGVSYLQHWNDARGRTADEVITALRDYAIKVRPDAMELPGNNS